MNVSPRFHAAANARTEGVDPRFERSDEIPVMESLELQLLAQEEGLQAIRYALPQIEAAVLAATDVLAEGNGRLVYIGAGTSGRVGVQDGVELVPTFGWPRDRLAYLMAGGERALVQSVEKSEDNVEQAAQDIQALNITKDDVVIGIAASGTTPYTICALHFARDMGATTIAIANNADAPLLDTGQFPVSIVTGPEFIAGSTRLKAGTTQKIALSMISNQIMIGLNKVYRGLMVDMQLNNEKLVKRGWSMIQRVTGCDLPEAQDALTRSDGHVKTAIMVAHGANPADARAALARTRGHLGRALTLQG